MPERGGPSLEDINFKAMKQESQGITEGFVAPEYIPPENQEVTEGADMELIKRLSKQEESITGLSREQRIRILEIENECGEVFSSLSPETKIALSKVEKSGKEMVLGEYAVGGINRDTGEKYYREKYGINPEQGLDWNNLVFLRKTDHLPKEQGDKLVMATAYESTKDMDTEERVFRKSLHWSVNHTVESHSLGDWENSQFTIIVPGAEMIEKNGNPDNLLSVDTFWEHGLEIPESAVVIVFGKSEVPQEISERLQIIRVQDSENLNNVTKIVLKIMGYTEIEAGAHYSYTSGFDEMITGLREGEGIESGTLHAYRKSLANSIENYFHPGLTGESRPGALEKMACEYWLELSREIKRDIIEDLEHISRTEIPVEEKHNTTYQALDSIIVDFKQKYEIEMKRSFVETLPRDVILDFVVNETKYWIKKESVDPNEQIGLYIKSISDYFGSEEVTWIENEAKKRLNV